jgi:hypothetical protein
VTKLTGPVLPGSEEQKRLQKEHDEFPDKVVQSMIDGLNRYPHDNPTADKFAGGELITDEEWAKMMAEGEAAGDDWVLPRHRPKKTEKPMKKSEKTTSKTAMPHPRPRRSAERIRANGAGTRPLTLENGTVPGAPPQSEGAGQFIVMVPPGPGPAPAAQRDQTGAFIPASFQFTVRPHDIAGGVEQLRLNGHDGSWMAFLFKTTKPSEETDDNDVALQYSVEDEQVGLDWVLLGPRNVADSLTVASFMEKRGHKVVMRRANEVDYLRVEDGDIADLGSAILEALYGVPPTCNLGLRIDGLVIAP